MAVGRTEFPRLLRSAYLICLVLGVSAACTSLGGVDWTVERAAIQHQAGDHLSLQVPATITAGVAATITLRTEGTRYCTRPSRTDVSAAGMLVTLEPYDSAYVGSLPCPSVPCDCAHTVNITFPSSGVATLRIIGRRGISADVVAVDTVLDVQ
jgi:hypothetical protein